MNSSIFRRNINALYFVKISKWFMLTMPILMLFYKDMGLSAEESFRLKSVYSILIIILDIPTGYLADLFGRKKLIVIGTILGFAGFCIYAISTQYIHFFAAEIVLGIGLSFVSGTDSALLYDSLTELKQERKYAKYEGRITALGNLAEAISALAGGILASISLRLPFQIQVFIALIGIPAALLLTEPMRKATSKLPTFTSIFTTINTEVLKRKAMLLQILFSAILGAATLSMAWIYQLYLVDLIGISLIQLGILAAILNLIVAIFSAQAYNLERYIKMKHTFVIFTFLIPGLIILIGVFDSIYCLIFLVLFYIARGYATPVFKDYVNRIASPQYRATILSFRNFSIRLVFAILAPLFGWFSDQFSYQISFYVLGSLFLIMLFTLLMLLLPHLKQNAIE